MDDIRALKSDLLPYGVLQCNSKGKGFLTQAMKAKGE